jgi:prephenate dehydrogenase
MGTFFKKVWETGGHAVQVSGRKTSCRPQDLARNSDVVMISVPIRDTKRVIEETAPYLTERQVLCDLTSLKMEPVQAMLQSHAEVIGLHPMFGPNIPSLKGQTIIACPARCSRETGDTILGMLERQGAHITITTPEEHDRMMAIIQGLTHFSTLCLAETMRRMGTDIDHALKCTSPIYRIEMGLIGRLLGQDPDLYGDLLTMNPFIPPMLAEFKQATLLLDEIIRKGDKKAFRAFFSENSSKFAPYSARATMETDAIIEFLVNS